MKLKILQTFFLLIALTAHSAMAEDFELSLTIDLVQYLDKDIASYSKFNNARIWGWSRDGKVAFSSTDRRSKNTIYFYIMDMITDEFVFADGYHSKEVYELRKEDRLNAMKTHAIEEYESVFLPFPIKGNGFEYNCFAETEESEKSEYVLSYDIIVSKNGKYKAIKTNVDTYRPDDVCVTAVHVCGYFLSPFENRALVVIAEAYEGDISFTYTFSGCHLGVGFN